MRSGSAGPPEFAVPGAAEERIPLGAREDEGRAGRVPRIAQGDLAVGQERYLDAVSSGRAAAAALDPGDVGQRTRGHAVAGTAHGDPSISSSIARMISLASFGRALIAPSRSMATV